LLRLWMCDWSETILAEDLASGRASARREIGSRHACGESARHARYRNRCGSLVKEGPSSGCEMQTSRGGVWRDSYCRAAVALRTGESAHRPAFAPASGFERKRNLRRGNSSVGRDDAGDLFGPASVPDGELRSEV